MPVTTTATANEIINMVAVEVGLSPDNDPVSSTADAFIQFTGLLNIAGRELVNMFEWELLNKAHQITTLSTDSGNYDLPDDFAYMINQTGWDRAQNIPLHSPLSPQDWTYLLGRDFASTTVYASFRLKQGKFSIFPQPPPNALDINFEYISKNWVKEGTTEKDAVTKGADDVLYDRLLVSRLLRLKFLTAKGFDTTSAQDDFNQIFEWITGQDKAAPVLSAGSGRKNYPYLDAMRNVNDTGYGVT